MTERGRDVAVVIEQYTSQVKPAFERFVRPSRKHADVIIPWSRRVPSNATANHRNVYYAHSLPYCRCKVLIKHLASSLPAYVCSALTGNDADPLHLWLHTAMLRMA